MNKKRLHVLFLPTWYPYDDDPMDGLFVQNHARAIAPFQKITVVHAVGKHGISGKQQLSVTEQNGFPEILIYYRKIAWHFPILSPIIKIFQLRQAICKGIKYMEKQYGKPDIIHAHVLTRYGVFAYFLSRRWQIPYVITEHWSRYLPERNAFKGFIRKWTTRQVVKKAKAILPVSHKLANAMQNYHLLNPSYQVVTNVTDTELFVPSAPKEKSSVFQFIHVSCFENEVKNITGIIDAINMLSQEKQVFRFVMVGDGPDFEATKNYCSKMNLNKIVTFTSLLTGNDLVHQYQQSHCLVMFSNYETQGVVINEAFACGLPVIATDVGGISEHLTSDKGILIKPKDTSGLQDAMIQMMANYDKYDAQSIRQYAVENFSYEQVGKQLNTIYLDTITASSNHV